jgi:WD40 repeat protein
MDNTAMLHRLDDKPPLKIVESTYIRSILPMEHVEGAEHLLLTGSDDEDIRVYDVEDMEKGQPRLLAVVPGHAFQVSDLAVWSDGTAWELLSTSFDQTIRRWTLSSELGACTPHYPYTADRRPPASEADTRVGADTGQGGDRRYDS